MGRSITNPHEQDDRAPNYGTLPEFLDPRRGAPESSWWADAPRDGFTALASSQQDRMQRSKVGRSVDGTYPE